MPDLRNSSGHIDGRIQAPEPTYAECFYNTSNQRYNGYWHDGTRGTSVSPAVPTISEILGSRGLRRQAPRAITTTAKCLLGNAIAAEKLSKQTDKVLSSDVIPKNFPARAEDTEYPESAKRGSDNPLYGTSSQSYGYEPPMAHQISDRFFPSDSKHTQSYVDLKPRYTGLVTKPTYSKVHSALDKYI